MKLSKIIILAAVFCIYTAGSTYAATLLYVPCDNRPVCFNDTVETLKFAGYDVITPLAGLLASRYSVGDSDKLWSWFTANVIFADAVVVSADSMVYGGLVPSRIHTLDEQIISERVARFKELRENNSLVRIYVFATLDRSPKMSAGGTDPAYYEQVGPQIFRLGALLDKKELGGLSRQEQKELDSLQNSIPQENLEDWNSRRAKNLQIHKTLIEYLRKNIIDYYLIGRDDSSPYSFSHKEASSIAKMAAGISPTKFMTFGGADQLGMIMLTRAVNFIESKMPYVALYYAPGVGGKTIPNYQDNTADENIRGQIIASGAFCTSSIDRADLILAVNTPKDGVTLESDNSRNTTKLSSTGKSFVEEVLKYISKKKAVAVADIAYANGADNSLMQELAYRKILKRLKAYSGWNTASNTIGFALNQGMLAIFMPEARKNRLIAGRLLDDWAYQANVRSEVLKNKVYPIGCSAVKLGENKADIESETNMRLHQFADINFAGFGYNDFRITHPWDRMFEIGLEWFD